MKSIAAIAQCRASQEPEKNLCKAEFFCREAREESACFVIFPESVSYTHLTLPTTSRV